MLVPIALMLVLRCMVGMWHNQDEVRNLHRGHGARVLCQLLVVHRLRPKMPMAMSALTSGWSCSQRFSSPLTTPLIFHLFGFVTTGDYAEDLHEMAQQGTNAFLCLTVVLPSLLGMALRFLLGEGITSRETTAQTMQFCCLLLLNYSNASTNLPQVLRLPDWDYLGIILVTFQQQQPC
ncbi:MAG: bile acid:sodium symporter [Candidatus Obscuribacter sp.]|nr:bile acid:sodium symporter [Candidatus Obscuribacter sp.]